MTKEAYKQCIGILEEIKTLNEYLKELPKLKDKYTPIESKVRKEYYILTRDELLSALKDTKKDLTTWERFKLVFK